MTTTPTLRDAAQAVTIITTPSGDHRWIAKDAAEVVHFSQPGQGHKIEVYTLAAPADAPPKWPKDAAEVRAFMGVNFEVMKFGSEDQTPHDDDRYQLTAHDFLSAVDWWADHPHYQPEADALAEPVAYFDTENNTLYWADEKRCKYPHGSFYSGAKGGPPPQWERLYTAPPATQLQQAVARAIEECAVICEGMHEEDRPGDYAYAIRQEGKQ